MKQRASDIKVGGAYAAMYVLRHLKEGLAWGIDKWFWIIIKGVVCRYCFDAKPSNLTAYFIMKCDAICYYYMHQNGGEWTAVYNNV